MDIERTLSKQENPLRNNTQNLSFCDAEMDTHTSDF